MSRLLAGATSWSTSDSSARRRHRGSQAEVRSPHLRPSRTGRSSPSRGSQAPPFLPRALTSPRVIFYGACDSGSGLRFATTAPAQASQDATNAHRGSAHGPDGDLESYVAGQPSRWTRSTSSPIPILSPRSSGLRLHWQGARLAAHAYHSYFDRGEELPLFYEGSARQVSLAHRPDPPVRRGRRGCFRGEFRSSPTESTYSHRTIQRHDRQLRCRPPTNREAGQDDHTSVYLPTLRRVRRTRRRSARIP